MQKTKKRDLESLFFFSDLFQIMKGWLLIPVPDIGIITRS